MPIPPIRKRWLKRLPARAWWRPMAATSSVPAARMKRELSTPNTRATPASSPLSRRARRAAGSKPERLIPRAQDGAAESLFGIAASLTDETSADVAILYLRLALYLSPDFDLAKIVLADRFEALKKFDDAIAVYRASMMI